MPSKSEIETRVNRIVQIFQKAMPRISTPYPSMAVATQRTYRDARALFIARTGVTSPTPTDELPTELIMGPKGSAIIIRKELVRNLDHLYHALWTELGRFYLLSGSATDKMGEGMKDFWLAFASEAIANRVERAIRKSQEEKNGEAVDWPEEQWRPVYDAMKIQLLAIYGQKSILTHQLSFHLAASLTDDLLVDMIRQAREGVLPGKEGQPFDPVGVEMMPVQLQPSMKELIATLERQMEKEWFWEASEDTLTRIDGLLKDMNEAYVELIADELIRDEVDAAPIPKELPDDLWDDLPEID